MGGRDKEKGLNNVNMGGRDQAISPAQCGSKTGREGLVPVA